MSKEIKEVAQSQIETAYKMGVDIAIEFVLAKVGKRDKLNEYKDEFYSLAEQSSKNITNQTNA